MGEAHVVNSGWVYYLTIVEAAPLEQEITASALFTKLENEGSVSLYINFDTGKATIKPESSAVIDEFVQMLQENEDLMISIEGHTDNVGAPASNQSLSLNRAKAVLTSITAKGISASRLKAAGWGQDKPVADNSSEEGRAQNLRVEIVNI